MSTQTPGNQGRIPSRWAAFLNTLKGLGNGVMVLTNGVVSVVTPAEPDPTAPVAYNQLRLYDGGTGAGVTVAIPEIDDWYPIHPIQWTQDVPAVGMLSDLVNGLITCVSATKPTYVVNATIIFEQSVTANDIEFGIFNDGTLLSSMRAGFTTDNSLKLVTVSITGITTLDLNKSVDVRVRSTSLTLAIALVIRNIVFSAVSV